MASPNSGDPASITGSLERVMFVNPEDGYVVGLVTDETGEEIAFTANGIDPTGPLGSKGKKDGSIEVNLAGTWTYNQRFNQMQIRASEVELDFAENLDGLKAYLKNAGIQGVGEKSIETVLGQFRSLEELIEACRRDENALCGLGVPDTRAKALHAFLMDDYANRGERLQAQSDLLGLGLDARQTAKVMAEWGTDAMRRVRNDPYELTHFDQIGFSTADEVAGKLGISGASPSRLIAGQVFTLEQAEGDGHTLMNESAFYNKAAELLGVPRSAVEQNSLLRNDPDYRVEIEGELYVQRPRLHKQEAALAAMITHRLQEDQKEKDRRGGVGRLEPVPEEAMVTREGFPLTDTQKGAVQNAVSHRVSCITGVPGAGKTTLARIIAQHERTHSGASGKERVVGCALSGKAAQNMKSLVHEGVMNESSTIHSLLGFDGKDFRHDANHPIDADLVILDEASMVDTGLFKRLVEALPKDCSLVILGDTDQLPSIGPGYILGSFKESGVVPFVELTATQRQQADSGIVDAAMAIREERPIPLDKHEDFRLDEAVQEETQKAAEATFGQVIEHVRGRMSEGVSPNDIQVLSPMKKGAAGTQTLNQHLQSLMNPDHGQPSLQYGDKTFRVGDRVLQTRNDYNLGLMNGDTARVVGIENNNRELVVEAPSGAQARIDREAMANLELGYAMTVHKTQGSQYPHVVMALSSGHYAMLNQRILYTGFTRAQESVALVGQEKAVRLCESQKMNIDRETGLVHQMNNHIDRIGLKREWGSYADPLSAEEKEEADEAARLEAALTF